MQASNDNVVEKIETVSWKFKWVINNIYTACKNVGECVKSPRFMMSSEASSVSRKIQWYQLTLHPKGDNEESKDFMSLYLSVNTEITAVAIFKILNSKNEVVFTRILNEAAVFNKVGTGYREFVPRNFILGILKDDKLTIVCEITSPSADEEKTKKEENEINKNEEKKMEESVEKTESEKEEDKEDYESYEIIFKRLEEFDKYEDLINQEEFSDVSLIVEGKVVKVHKCILAKSSTVFATMFRAEMKEKQDNTVEITDIKHDVLVEMIRFIYAGKVNNIDAIADQLAPAADKYALDGLKDICEETMYRNLSVDNAIESLKIADRHRMDKLKEQTIDFIIQNAEDVTSKPEFKFLPFDVVCEICCALAKNNKK